MTEKRFHIINDADNLQKYGIFCKPVVVDNETDKKYILALDLLDLLNKFYEENEELKSELKALRKKYNDFSDAVDKRLKELRIE